MRLPEQEITYLIEVDSSVSGRLYVSKDDSKMDRQRRESLIQKGLLELSEDGEAVYLTDEGQVALKENE